MSASDPLSMLLGKKREEEETQKKAASTVPVRLEASSPLDVNMALGRGSRQPPTSLFGDPLPDLTSASLPSSSPPVGGLSGLGGGLGGTSGLESIGGSGGYPRSTPPVSQPPATSTPEEDPFRLVLSPTPLATSGGGGGLGGGLGGGGGGGASASAAANAALGAAAGAAGAALSAVGGLLRSSAPAAAAAATAAPSGSGLASLANSSAAGAGLPPPSSSAVPPGTTFEDILAGEKVHVVVKSCFLLVANPLCELRGRLLVTNYRLKFQTPKGTLREELHWMREASYFDVPMGTIEDIKEEKSTTVAGVLELKLKVVTKDFRTIVLLPSTEGDCRSVLDAVAAFGVPGNPTLLFAFKHAEEVWGKRMGQSDLDGWNIYDPLQEYKRMGIETELFPTPGSPWRVSSINAEYGLCSTYPSLLAVPRRMGDHDLRAVAGFRKRQRLPAMSWCGGPELSFASLWRCSQTTEGLMGQKCNEDQQMVESIRRGSTSQADRDLLVIDLRPWKSAWANKAGGGGFEGYPKCRLVFGGIDNVHAVRDAWRAMGAAVHAVIEGEVGSWLKDVANSSWYDYMGAILGSTLKVVKEILEHRSSVMVHCSEGWDRTAQATSLSMLCLDPHYRTQAGFLRLIQKEWCSFGHRFRTRLALGEPPSSEYSPVFIQWLECVYQLYQQFPSAFEFTPAVLLRLAQEVISNRYGTFLCDSEKERSQKVMPFAISLWSVLLRPEDAATWRNPLYRPDQTPVIPSVCQANYVIWEEYWWRFHPRGQRLKAAHTNGFQASQPPPLAQAAPAAPPDGGAGSREEAAFALPAASPQAGSAASLASASPGATEREAPPASSAAAPAGGGAAAGGTAAVPSLFSGEELTSSAVTKARQPPKQVFADDDDEEDVFALHGKRFQKDA